MGDIDGTVVHHQPMSPWNSAPYTVTSYSNVTARDHSRIHNGHVFHFHQHCAIQHHEHDSAENSSQATLKRKRSLADVEANPRTPQTQESLDTVLKKLGKLSLSIRHRKDGAGAEKIARRIAAVIEAITMPGEVETWDEMTARHLGKLGATMKWEEEFDINSAPPRKIMNRNAKARTRRIVAQIGRWNISLTRTTVCSRCESGPRDVDILSTLRVEPQRQSSGSALAVFFSEHRNGRSTITIPPTVLAYNMVKDDAQVFRMIIDDMLDGLITLLVCGKASIHDCDEAGRSLLHVGLLHRII